MTQLLPKAAMVGPGLMVIAALCVSLDVKTLPGDLDWISEPEAFLGYVASIFLVATWICVGRTIAPASPRAGIAVTLLGVVAAVGWTNPFVSRLMSIDLVEQGYDPADIEEVWNNPSLFSALAVPVTFMAFVVPLIAGVAILRTAVAPKWSGWAMIAFVPLFITAQAGYVAIRVTYLGATALLLAGVVGTIASGQRTTPPDGTA